MVSAESARFVIGVIGNVISFGLFLSPVHTFWKIIKKKAVEDFSPDPYLATVLNCAFWVFYGMPFVHPDSTLVYTINGIGLGIEFAYLGIYFYYAQTQGRKWVLSLLAIEVLIFAVPVVITLLVLHGARNRSMLIGIICVFFNVIMYASPLTVMTTVCKNKSVKYMPFYLSLANFLNGCVWTSYALIKIDYYMLISNGLGAISGTAQLILYVWYYKPTPKDGDDFDGKPTTEVQPSNADVAAKV